MHLHILQFLAHLQKNTRDFKAKKNQKEQNASWFLSYCISPSHPHPKSKTTFVKKSSLVLASISKKCKLKFDKNISKCRIFQLEFPVKNQTIFTML